MAASARGAASLASTIPPPSPVQCHSVDHLEDEQEEAVEKHKKDKSPGEATASDSLANFEQYRQSRLNGRGPTASPIRVDHDELARIVNPSSTACPGSRSRPTRSRSPVRASPDELAWEMMDATVHHFSCAQKVAAYFTIQSTASSTEIMHQCNRCKIRICVNILEHNVRPFTVCPYCQRQFVVQL